MRSTTPFPHLCARRQLDFLAVRMLATPLRQCTISKRYLPNGTCIFSGSNTLISVSYTDFLIRLAVLRLPTAQDARSIEVLMPDGLEHPKYKRRNARVAVYVSCWKDAVKTMKSPGGYLDSLLLTRSPVCPPIVSLTPPLQCQRFLLQTSLFTHQLSPASPRSPRTRGAD